MSDRQDNRSELFLVLRAQVGDSGAFDELFRVVAKPLYRYIVHLVDDPDLAEDILQDVLLLIYRKIGWLENPALFRPWSYRIASRECFKRLKSRRRLETLDAEHMDAIVEESVESEFDVELVSKLPTLIARLSSESRTAIVLHYLHEFSLRETAEILGISVGTAKSRVAYGLKALRLSIRKMDQEK
jgi:RNA polymerase sigma-70 factor, ECF subfamily